MIAAGHGHPGRPISQEGLATALLALAMALGLCAAFAVWTASDWLAFPRFLLAVGLLYVLPGSFLVRWWQLPLSRIEELTLATVLGMVVTSFLYAIAAWSGYPQALWAWIAAGGLGLLGKRRSWRRALRSGLESLRGSHALLLLALTAGWMPLATLTHYYRNLARTGQGTLSFVELPDVLLHASVAAELTHTVPPQVPFIAGERLSYHVGMDLVAAVLNRFGGVSVPDLLVRFCPTLFVAVAMLAVYCLARRLTGSGAAGAAAALLAVLGEDLSFVPGLLRGSQAVWCAEYFQAPTVFSQYAVNPMALAHALLFSALLCVHRSLEDPRRGWIAAASICSAALMQTKIFAYVQLTLAIGAVAAVHLVRFRRLELLRLSVGVVLASLPFLLFMAVSNRGGGQFVWTWSSGPGAYLDHAARQAQWPLLAAYPALGLIVFLAMTFGFRAVGFADLARALVPLRGRPFPLLLAVFVLLGPLLTLTTKVVPREHPFSYDNAVWFLVQSKYVATLFAIGALARLWPGIGRLGRWIALATVAITALASTVQFLERMPVLYPLRSLDAAALEVVDYLNRAARPGDVVISPIDESLLALTRLRTPYYPLYASSFADGETLAARQRDLEEFRSAWARGKVRTDLALKYQARWIVDKASPGTDRIRGRGRRGTGSRRLREVFSNAEFRVFRVLAPLPRGASQRPPAAAPKR